MIDLVEIYVHWYAGRSQVQIADSLGLDRKTVRKYLAPVTAEGLVPGGPPVMSEADWRARAASTPPRLRSCSCPPWRPTPVSQPGRPAHEARPLSRSPHRLPRRPRRHRPRPRAT